MTDRRDFLLSGAALGAAALLPTAVHAAGDDSITVGVIGAGGRASGAAENCLEADKATKIVAMCDFFPAKAKNSAASLLKKFGKERVAVGDNLFGGLDGYKQVIAQNPDVIIIATPPGFRPTHLEAIINADKKIHIFCEKPVAVDGPGIRKCLELAEKAKSKDISIVAGTQRRHQAGYIETVKRLHDGAIGDIVGGNVAWNGQGIWFHPRQQNMSDLDYQINNWYHFLWLCGDHIVEQHVHNLDVANWVMGAHPVKAVGIGGRSYRDMVIKAKNPGDPQEVGQIWDHFAIEYTYPNDVVINSQCAHIPGIQTDISESFVGTKGRAQANSYRINKKKVAGRDPVDSYVQEHIDLIDSIRSGKRLNELKQVAESTMTAILGRMACYSGENLSWEQGLNSQVVQMPSPLSETTPILVKPAPRPDKYKV